MAALAPPWPPPVDSVRWTLESNTSRFTSPLSKSTQMTAKSGARWRANVRLTMLTDTELRQWSSFLERVQDEGRTFLFGPSYPRGRPLAYPGTDTAPWGTPHAQGGSGTQLTVLGFAAAATMKRGDWFSFHNGNLNELHRLIKDVTADGSGNATLDFVPPLRNPLPSEIKLYFDGYQTDPFQRAVGEFMLASNDSASFGESFDFTNDLAFDIIEPLNDFTPDQLASLAAWFRWRVGLTVPTGSEVSAWADQSGNGRNLLQATSPNRPALQSDYSIRFDGVDNYLQCAPFTLNQPTTVYILFKQNAWTANDTVFDGNTGSTGILYQAGTTPELRTNAGSGFHALTTLALGTYGVFAMVFNGASATTQHNLGTVQVGNTGAGNMGGLTLGTSGANYGSIDVREVILYSAAHDAATRQKVIEYLANLGGVTL